MSGYTFGNGLTASFGAPATTASAPDAVFDTTTSSFASDVLEASAAGPVLVDFWAPWCGPCKQLGPMLEKIVRAYRGKVRLAKMNIDEHPQIAGQLGIQSIPAVVAFVKGRPADAFMGAVPEGQIKSFIERLTGGAASDIDQMVAAANEALALGEIDAAAEAFAAVLEEVPDHAGAIGGLARVHIARGDLARAREVLAMAPQGKESDPAIAAARAQIELAEQAAETGEIPELEARVAASPADHQARFDLAIALNAKGDARGAVNHLVEIVRRERGWNDEAARKQLVQFFEAWGASDPDTLYGRRRLSSVLFS